MPGPLYSTSSFPLEAPMGTQNAPFYILPKYQLIKVSAQKSCCSGSGLRVANGNKLTSVARRPGQENDREVDMVGWT